MIVIQKTLIYTIIVSISIDIIGLFVYLMSVGKCIVKLNCNIIIFFFIIDKYNYICVFIVSLVICYILISN